MNIKIYVPFKQKFTKNLNKIYCSSLKFQLSECDVGILIVTSQRAPRLCVVKVYEGRNIRIIIYTFCYVTQFKSNIMVTNFIYPVLCFSFIFVYRKWPLKNTFQSIALLFLTCTWSRYSNLKKQYTVHPSVEQYNANFIEPNICHKIHVMIESFQNQLFVSPH